MHHTNIFHKKYVCRIFKYLYKIRIGEYCNMMASKSCGPTQKTLYHTSPIWHICKSLIKNTNVWFWNSYRTTKGVFDEDKCMLCRFSSKNIKLGHRE